MTLPLWILNLVILPAMIIIGLFMILVFSGVAAWFIWNWKGKE